MLSTCVRGAAGRRRRGSRRSRRSSLRWPCPDGPRRGWGPSGDRGSGPGGPPGSGRPRPRACRRRPPSPITTTSIFGHRLLQRRAGPSGRGWRMVMVGTGSRLHAAGASVIFMAWPALSRWRRRGARRRPRSIVRRRPSSSSTFGSQPSRSRARAMSGWRTCGSSTGSASKTISERDSVTSITVFGQLEQRELVRVADVDRHVRRRTRPGRRARGSGRRRNRSCGSGCRRRRRSAACPAAPGAGRSGSRGRRAARIREP